MARAKSPILLRRPWVHRAPRGLRGIPITIDRFTRLVPRSRADSWTSLRPSFFSSSPSLCRFVSLHPTERLYPLAASDAAASCARLLLSREISSLRPLNCSFPVQKRKPNWTPFHRQSSNYVYRHPLPVSSNCSQLASMRTTYGVRESWVLEEFLQINNATLWRESYCFRRWNNTTLRIFLK